MIDYKIYHLYFDGIDDSYVGLTKNLKQRKKLHLQSCSNPAKQNVKLYKFINDHNLKKLIKYEVLDEFKCDTVQEAKDIERSYIETIEPTLNSLIPNRTKQEYFQKFKSEIYRRRNNKNLLKREQYKKKSLKYYYDNKEERNRKHREYMQTEKGKKATENRKRQIFCVCGCQMSFSSHREHKKSQWHKEYFLKHLLESKQKLIYRNKNIDIRI